VAGCDGTWWDARGTRGEKRKEWPWPRGINFFLPFSVSSNSAQYPPQISVSGLIYTLLGPCPMIEYLYSLLVLYLVSVCNTSTPHVLRDAVRHLHGKSAEYRQECSGNIEIS